MFSACSIRRIFYLVVSAILMSCTDGRRPPAQFPTFIPPQRPSTIVPVADVRFQDKDTQALQMKVRGGDLYLTGRPFGFARWNISSSPESPSPTFAASDEIDKFSPYPELGRWHVDWYASRALHIDERYAFMSGTAGTSVVDISDLRHPREVTRYPKPEGDKVIQDEAFAYHAFLPHPRLPLLLGFREQDFIYSLNVKNLPSLSLVTKDNYSSAGSICCVGGAASFNGQAFVALRSRLLVLGFGNSGKFEYSDEYTAIQAADVVTTPDYLYILHRPDAGLPSELPAGIYAFDVEMRNVAYFDIGEIPVAFAVNWENTHIYMNVDDTTVRILRIQRFGSD